MNKKLLLTSFVALGFACPAMADTTTAHSSDTFPNASQGQYMQEDYTYTGAATETNMAGVYQDNATVYANAHYSNASYTVTAGHYLPADSENPDTPCTDGSFCAGLQSPVNYNENSAQGIETCPQGFDHSDSNASANTQCYRTCDINNMGANGTIAAIAHAASLTGHDYYGNGTDTCEPDSCVHGWHIKNGLNLSTSVGTGKGASRAYTNSSGSFTEDSASYGQSFYGIANNDPMAFAVNYGNNGIIHGHARCSKTPGSNGWYTNGEYDGNNDWSNTTLLSSLTDETGQEGAKYCYCQVDGYTPLNGTLQSVSSSWAFNSDRNDASNCANYCADFCSRSLQYASSDYLGFRAAVLGSVEPTLASCAANTINITWQGASSEAINANEAGSVTYGGDIRTPQSAIHVPGKVFDGWEFSTTAPSNGNE